MPSAKVYQENAAVTPTLRATQISHTTKIEANALPVLSLRGATETDRHQEHLPERKDVDRTEQHHLPSRRVCGNKRACVGHHDVLQIHRRRIFQAHYYDS